MSETQNKYPKVQIAPLSQAPVILTNATVVVSQRRQKIKNGQDPSVMKNEKSGSPYDYLMVCVNNSIYRFPVAFSSKNDSLLKAIEQKNKGGKYALLKVSGVIVPQSEQWQLNEKGEMIPQTMEMDMWSESGTYKQHLQIINCQPAGMMNLALAATKQAVDAWLESGDTENDDDGGMPAPDPEPVVPAATKAAPARRAPQRAPSK